MRQTFQSFQNRGPKRASSQPSGGATPSSVPAATLNEVGSFLKKVMSPMWMKAAETGQHEVVPGEPGETRDEKSWATANGVITGLTQYERVALNAMEERVLPPDVRIKIVFAQANAGEDEEEIEEDVKRLDGLVRTLALYAILERKALASSTLGDLSPERARELGKMLVAAVQLELFQMLDDICEAGDVENELFDDLCCDTIQEGARTGFVHLTAELLLSPGSGYKRLLQIRKDQLVEIIADVTGIRAIGAHDIHSPASEHGQDRGDRTSFGAMDSACGSPSKRSSLGEAGSNGGTGGTTNEESEITRISPKLPTMSKSRSVSPARHHHHRTQTERVRELLSSIDGLVTNMEQSSGQASLTGLVDLPPLSPEGLQWRPGAIPGQVEGGGAGGSVGGGTRRGSATSAEEKETIPSSPLMVAQDDPLEVDKTHRRAFFPEENDSLQPCSDPIALAEGRSPIPTIEGDNSSPSLLLSEVDWLIAGTRAALGEDPGMDLGAGSLGTDSLHDPTALGLHDDGVDVSKPETSHTMPEEPPEQQPAGDQGKGESSPDATLTTSTGSATREETREGGGERASTSSTWSVEADSFPVPTRCRIGDFHVPGADDDDADDGGQDERPLWASGVLVSRAGTAATGVDRAAMPLTKSLSDRINAARVAVAQVKSSHDQGPYGSAGEPTPSTLTGMEADTDGDEDFEPVVSKGVLSEKASSAAGVVSRARTDPSKCGATQERAEERPGRRARTPRTPLGARGFKEVRLGPALVTEGDPSPGGDRNGEGTRDGAGGGAVPGGKANGAGMVRKLGAGGGRGKDCLRGVTSLAVKQEGVSLGLASGSTREARSGPLAHDGNTDLVISGDVDFDEGGAGADAAKKGVPRAVVDEGMARSQHSEHVAGGNANAAVRSLRAQLEDAANASAGVAMKREANGNPGDCSPATGHTGGRPETRTPDHQLSGSEHRARLTALAAMAGTNGDRRNQAQDSSRLSAVQDSTNGGANGNRIHASCGRVGDDVGANGIEKSEGDSE